MVHRHSHHMEGLLHAILFGARKHNDDDFVDRLNRYYTPWLFTLFSIIVLTKHYVGEPIECWVPAQFTDSWNGYANKYCWIANTYHVPFSQKNIPEPNDPRNQINYYQWVPLILLVQAFLFYIPSTIWHFLSDKSGLDVRQMVQAAATLRHGSYSPQREQTKTFIVDGVLNYFTSIHKPRKRTAKVKALLCRLCIVYGKSNGSYVTTMYLFTKLLYIANAALQLFTLTVIIGKRYPVLAWELLQNMYNGRHWQVDEWDVFPRVTLCDFQIRVLANIQRYTVQCVLPINLFHEKIYIFIWYWLIIVASLTTINLLLWIVRSVLFYNKIRYVSSVLPVAKKESKRGKNMTKFVAFFRTDGVLLMRLIGVNVNKVVLRELVTQLFDSVELVGNIPDIHDRRLSKYNVADDLNNDPCDDLE